MVFENFPKIRPELPLAYREIYEEHYKANRDGASSAAGMAQRLESWMHRKVAGGSKPGQEVLEVGAGTLNHLPYEVESQAYDIVEPFTSLFESSAHLSRVRSIYAGIEEIPDDNKYDRIVSVATFEHILDLPAVVARCGHLLKEGGSLQVGIPSEGTILWRLGYTMTTGLEFRRRYGLDYEVLMRYEHCNRADEIEEVLRYFFSSVETRAFGVARALSLYQFHRCTKPRLDACSRLLKEREQVI